MPRLTGHFETVLRGKPCAVTYVYDCDDRESCYECVEVAVAGLALTSAERRRLVAKACDAAQHRFWRDGADRPRRRA